MINVEKFRKIAKCKAEKVMVYRNQDFFYTETRIQQMFVQGRSRTDAGIKRMGKRRKN